MGGCALQRCGRGGERPASVVHGWSCRHGGPAVATVIVLAHVACCSRSVVDAPTVTAAIGRLRRDVEPTDSTTRRTIAGLAGDDQQLLVGEMAHPPDLAPGWVEDADAGPDVASRVEGERRHLAPRRLAPAGPPSPLLRTEHIASSSSSSSHDSSL